METLNYLDILIEGYCERGNYFKDYLIGKIREFEKMHISKVEFIERLGNEIDNCIKKINSSFDRDLLRYKKDSLKKKKDKMGYPKPYKYKIDIKDEQHPHIICLSPNALTNGKVKTPEFLYLSDFEQMKNIVSEIKDIKIKETVDSDKEFTNTKIIWNGTPAEFGRIMNDLIEFGYIKGHKQRIRNVNSLLTHFEVKTDEGTTANSKYLDKCFNADERMKNWKSSEYKLPLSENKDK
jgi:hypothetical protein